MSFAWRGRNIKGEVVAVIPKEQPVHWYEKYAPVVAGTMIYYALLIDEKVQSWGVQFMTLFPNFSQYLSPS